jgi:hypothetical protein
VARWSNVGAQPDRPKKIGGLSAEQMARMEREMDGLQREFKAVWRPMGIPCSIWWLPPATFRA